MSLTKHRWIVGGISGTVLSALFLMGQVAHADAPVVSGFVDTTYNYNFNKPYTQANELRSFDAKANNFAINAAQVQVAGTAGDAGYVVKFLAGSDASVITSAGSGAADDFDLEEAYLTYKCPMTLLNLKAGKFVTPEGIEVIESKDDPTISRGYLFGLAEAYTHTGVMISRTFGMIDIGAGVVNGWDLTTDNNTGKTIVGKLGLNFGDPLGIVVSGLHGPEQAENISTSTVAGKVNGNNRDSIDVTATIKIIPKTTLYAQANWGTEKSVATNPYNALTVRDSWHGFGLQPVVAITSKFSVGSRLEYFYDRFSSRFGTAVAPTTTATLVDNAFTNFTIAPAYKLTDTTTFRVEYRYDTSNNKVFTDDKGVAKDNASTVSVQWLQTF